MTCNDIKNIINARDDFAKRSHIVLTCVREGHAESMLTADASMHNAMGVVQGGAIFTLADLAFAGAANSYDGLRCTAMTSTISFLRPGTGTTFTAVADVLHKGRRSCLVEIVVRDEHGKLVAKVSTTGFFV